MFECSTRAPTRVDLAGGTLDMWPLASILQEKHDLWRSPVVTVNTALSLHASCNLKISPSKETQWKFRDSTDSRSHDSNSLDNGAQFPLHRGVCRTFARALAKHPTPLCVELSTNAMAPKGSGLGGSSSVVVAILGAFKLALEHFGLTVPKGNLDRPSICELGKNIEAGVLGGLAGNQDHFGAAFGGVQAVQHDWFGSRTQVLQTNGTELMSHVVLAHSGVQHFSIFNNWLVLEKVLTGDKEILSKLADIAAIARELCAPLEKNNWAESARILTKEWEIRRTLAPGISTPELDALYDAAMKSGAMGAKVCGAGGGGVLVAMAKTPDHRAQLAKSLSAVGGQILEAEHDSIGLVSRKSLQNGDGFEKIL